MGCVRAREGEVWDDSDFELGLLAPWWRAAKEGNLREKDFSIDTSFRFQETKSLSYSFVIVNKCKGASWLVVSDTAEEHLTLCKFTNQKLVDGRRETHS